MKRMLLPFLLFLVAGFSVKAQDKKEKMDENDEIIIKKKSDKDSKVVIEIKDGVITINGKPVDEFDDETISIRLRTRPEIYFDVPGTRFRSVPDIAGLEDATSRYKLEADRAQLYTTTSRNKAFLGVSSEGTEKGLTILSVTAKSAAEKAGLKKDDIILKINEAKVATPNDLTKAIGKYKPEEKITITYLRDGKEAKTTATLGKNSYQEAVTAYGLAHPRALAPLRSAPFDRAEGFDFNWNGEEDGLTLFGGLSNKPRLGIKAQDTEDGKGVKVLDVAKESAAEKAGIKEGDIITQFDGKAINSADELMETAMEAKAKPAVKVEISRDGKSQTLEIKTPRKLKTANL